MSATDQWDINTNIGVTAVAVAAARASESSKPDALINDPYAEMLVAATDTPLQLGEELSEELGEEHTQLWATMTNYMAIRTHFLDNFFAQANEKGARQAVILASGLDTRAYRLSWPAGFRLFEIDQPKVLDFKDTVLSGAGAKPSCQRYAVGVDLRDDWAAALIDAGFSTELPTAWLGEGLLPYLPAAAEAQLLSTMNKLSAAGSHIALEHANVGADFLRDNEMREHGKKMGVDVATLMNSEPRPHPGDELSGYGWTVQRKSTFEVAQEHGRELGRFGDHMRSAQFVTAHN